MTMLPNGGISQELLYNKWYFKCFRSFMA